MQKEKLAAVGLVIIVVGALSAFLILDEEMREQIFGNLFGEPAYEGPVEIGDCVDVYYIGKYQVNNTIFDTNYEDIATENNLYNENRSYDPLKVFINPNYNLTPPSGYEEYLLDFLPFGNIIPGFSNGLIGMEVGETKTVEVEAEDAYGSWNSTIAELFGMGTYPLVTVINSTATENKTLFLQSFTDVNLTEGTTFDYGVIAFEEEGVLNATILAIDDINITYKLLPENGTIITLPIFNWDITFIVENDTAFTMRSLVEENHTFSIESFYGNMYFKVLSVNETDAVLAMNIDAPAESFIDQGLIFELEVVKAYDTS